MQALAVLFAFGVGMAFLALWVYALISAITNERLDSSMRLVWVIVIVFVTGLGALLYLIIAPNRPTRDERALADWHRRNAELQRRVQQGSSAAVPPVLGGSGPPPA